MVIVDSFWTSAARSRDVPCRRSSSSFSTVASRVRGSWGKRAHCEGTVRANAATPSPYASSAVAKRHHPGATAGESLWQKKLTRFSWLASLRFSFAKIDVWVIWRCYDSHHA